MMYRLLFQRRGCLIERSVLMLQANVCGIKMQFNSISVANEADFFSWCAEEGVLIVHVVEENFVQAMSKLGVHRWILSFECCSVVS